MVCLHFFTVCFHIAFKKIFFVSWISTFLFFNRFSINNDGFVKSLQGRHSREACPRPDRGAGVHKQLNFLDSRFHGNDNSGFFLTFHEFINHKSPIINPNRSIHQFGGYLWVLVRLGDPGENLSCRLLTFSCQRRCGSPLL